MLRYRIAAQQVILPTTTRATAMKPDSILPEKYKPPFYNDYLRVMHAILNKNNTEINKILTDSDLVTDIVNYQDPERDLQTPLHFLLSDSKNCLDSMINTLCRFGALPNLSDKQNQTAYMLAEHCDNWLKIKPIFDNQNEVGLIPYTQQKFVITIVMPISAFFSGVLAGGLKEIAQRNKRRYPYLPSLIFYGLQPISLAMASASMNFLIIGNAAAIGIEDVGLSFAFYLGIHYFGLLFAQLGEKFTKRIQNKVLNFLIPVILYTFYLNPSLMIKLISEGFTGVGFQEVMMPLLSMLSSGVFYKTGEWGTKKVVKSIFFTNTPSSRKNITFEFDSSSNSNQENTNLLNNVATCLANLKIDFHQIKSKDYYKIFENNLNSLCELLENINELDKAIFDECSKIIEKIIKDLEALEPKKNKKIKKLLTKTRDFKAAFNSLRPSKQLDSLKSSSYPSIFSAVKDELPPPPDAENCLELGIPFSVN